DRGAQRRLRSDRGRAGPRRAQPRHAPFLPGLPDLDVHPAAGPGLVRQRPAVAARRAWLVRALRRDMDQREAALGDDAGRAQLREGARPARLRTFDQGVCGGGGAPRRSLTTAPLLITTATRSRARTSA